MNITDLAGGLIELPKSPSGQVLGSLYVPARLSDQLNTSLVISFVDFSDLSSNQELASSVLNITLFDDHGNSLTQLTTPLTICLALQNGTKKSEKACLSFYDERARKWKCEDKCGGALPPFSGHFTVSLLLHELLSWFKS